MIGDLRPREAGIRSVTKPDPSAGSRSPSGRRIRPLAGLVLILLAGAPSAAAQSDGVDYHRRFESLCGPCHGHSGPFARHSLEIVNGTLVGRTTGVPVQRFLRRHPGGLTQADIARFRDVMHRQVEAGGVFQDRCAICHGRAVELAAANLVFANGDLLIRYSRVPVRGYLANHGRLEPREIEIVHQALLEAVARR